MFGIIILYLLCVISLFDFDSRSITFRSIQIQLILRKKNYFKLFDHMLFNVTSYYHILYCFILSNFILFYLILSYFILFYFRNMKFLPSHNVLVTGSWDKSVNTYVWFSWIHNCCSQDHREKMLKYKEKLMSINWITFCQVYHDKVKCNIKSIKMQMNYSWYISRK